ncbi:MAG: Pr6Pr family membrane protein, partial [Candidatus Saccharimonadales bacterium]
LKLYRAAAGLLGACALTTEIATLIERGIFIPSNFFSFFTIQSNILAVCLLMYGALYGFTKVTTRSVQLLRGGVTLYMVMTGVIFAILLAGIEGATLTAVPWDNIVLHYIMPIVILFDWLADTTKPHIAFRCAWVWLLFQLAYVAYSLIRGPIVNWYPYPFIDPTTSGYGAVTVTTIILAVGCLVVSWALCKTTKRV